MALATSNAFALLNQSTKVSKKESKKDDKRKDKGNASAADLEKAIFSQPSMGVSNWADDDDDDYTMPSLPVDWEEVRGGINRLRGLAQKIGASRARMRIPPAHTAHSTGRDGAKRGGNACALPKQTTRLCSTTRL
jgi:hypothetical protein